MLVRITFPWFSQTQNPGNLDIYQLQNLGLTRSEMQVFENEKLSGMCVLKCMNGVYSTSLSQSRTDDWAFASMAHA